MLVRSSMAVACCMLAAGCASTPASDDTIAGSERVLATGVSLPDGSAALRTTTAGSVATTIAAPPARLIPLVHAAYDSLGVPVTLLDRAAGRVGNLNFWKSRRLGGVPLSRIVDCGDGLTGPKADSYRVYLSVVTTLRPEANGGSVLATELVASASDVAGGNPDRIACGTTGMLETRIASMVRERAGG